MHSVFLPGRRGITALRTAAFIGLICVAATACGEQRGHSGNSSPRAFGGGRPTTARHSPTGHSPTGHPSMTVEACSSAELKVSLDLSSAGVAAGTSLIPVDFTNVSAHGCRLAGYAFVAFATSRQGKQVGASSTADRALAAKTLLLNAGQSAHLWLRIVEATNLPAAQCKPETVAGLRIKLPGQAVPVFISHNFRTCAKRIHGTDMLTVEPFQSGRAHTGTAQ